MISSLGERNFINRGEELKLIDSAFEALRDEKRLLRTPIIDFFGVDGMGKTSVLQEVRQRCQQQSLHYIWVNVNQKPEQFLSQWLRQARQLHADDQADTPKTAEDLCKHSVKAMKSLLEKEPIVALLDEVDSDKTEDIGWIETILHDLIDLMDVHNLFVVLASQQQVSFDKYRSVARKLISHQLKPFDQEACQSYLSDIAGTVDLAIREEIISWGQGYPLAMKVMSRLIQEQKLDPRVPADQKRLISALMGEVVDRGIFARIVEPDRLSWCKEYVSLLSIPRRFNLVILQNLTEKFAEKLKLAGKLEYLGLPRQINQGTDVLYWDMRKSGFTINETARRLFFRQCAIEQPERFYAIHRFLAGQNQQFAGEVNGSDRIRYLREYLYHSTFFEGTQTLPPLLARVLQNIASEKLDSIVQFSEELQQDEELKDALGPHLAIVTNFVNTTFKKEGE
jgi:adenylate kinase